MPIDVTAHFPILREWPRSTMSLHLVDTTVIHHTAVDPKSADPEVGLVFPAAKMTAANELNHIAVIHLYHKSRGFGGFGYHLIVFPSGRCYLVTPLDQWGAHVAGQNDHLWGVAFAGDFYDKLPGEPQMAGGREAVASTPKEVPIKPHLAYGGTACPGRLVEILDQLKEDDDMALQEIVEAHQGILDNLWDRMAGMEQARDSLIREIAELQQRPTGASKKHSHAVKLQGNTSEA